MLPLRMFLLFLLLPSDADLTCTQISLILDAPLVTEYGKEVNASCLTTERNFEEMTLSLGNTCCKNPQMDFSLHCVAPVSDFEMKAECKIKINDTFECRRELDITVYKSPEVTLSLKNGDVMQADYELQCDVFNWVPAQNLSVTWYKNNEIFKTEPFFESHNEVKNISYNLTVTISKEESFAAFRCETRLNLGQKIQDPIVSTTHNLSARYAPELRTNANKSITLPKDGNTTLLCDVEGNPPPEYLWTDDRETLLETTNSLEVTQVNSSSTYSCTATNPLGKKTLRFYVDVKEVTTATGPAAVPTPEAKEPENCGLTVTPSEIYVKYGDRASINCSTSSTDVAILSWETAVGKKLNRLNSSIATWMVEKLVDFTVEPFCFVTLNTDRQCIKKPNITLYKLPDSVEVFAVGNDSMKADHVHQLQCDIYSVAPANKLWVKWYKNNQTVTNSLKMLLLLKECLNNNNKSLCNASSVYTFIAKDTDDGAHFRCEAGLQFGPPGPLVTAFSASKPYIADVHYKPTIKDWPSKYSVEEDTFRLHDFPCKTDGHPQPAIKWYYNGTLIDPFKPLKRNDSGTYKAAVYNEMGQVYADVDIMVEYRPSFFAGSCKRQYEVKVTDKPEILCKLDGLPPPKISWFKNGTEIFPQHWKKHESGNYSLKASNKHGAALLLFYLDILYPPEFTEPDTTEDFIADSNVSLVCKADGNPKPEIHWIYQSAENVQETTVGRQKIITITGATSANAGLYSCNATNRVGSVTRHVTLMEKDKASYLTQFWWVYLVIPLVLIALLGIIYKIRNRKKHGRYSFDKHFPMQCISSEGNVSKSLLNGGN